MSQITYLGPGNPGGGWGVLGVRIPFFFFGGGGPPNFIKRGISYALRACASMRRILALGIDPDLPTPFPKS